MNINDNPDRLRTEEQRILDSLISQMDRVIDRLDNRMQDYVAEAKNSNISINPDLYLSKLLAEKGIKNTAENRKKLLQSRDELYHTRLLLQYDDYDGKEGIDEIKVGLHSCMYNAEQFVVSWKMPLCRHYILDNTSTEFENVVLGRNGQEFHTQYTLLMKNQIKLRFTRVAKALNMFPASFNDQLLEMIRGEGFFSDDFIDELIKNFNPDEYDPDEAAKIISDEFLQELLERRSSPEFKNIVFSIQKKQGEIIQAPYQKNMIVQGCAGSGKSMIMLHRLPILLYDHPDSLKKTNLYIITPSQMYIQLAENMRHQLEISDISMGTIEQYYDLCISRYPGHNAGEYGRISYSNKLNSEQESYIYSKRCSDDIRKHFDSIIGLSTVSLDKASTILRMKGSKRQSEGSYSVRIKNRLLDLQDVLNANDEVVTKYFKGIRDTLNALNDLSATLRHRQNQAVREITKRISSHQEEIDKAKQEIEKLNPDVNAKAIRNRNDLINRSERIIEDLINQREAVANDKEYFASVMELNTKIEAVLKPFENLNSNFSENSDENIYEALERTGHLIGAYYMLSWEFSKVEDKYGELVGLFNRDVQKVGQSVSALQDIKYDYLSYEYYRLIKSERSILSSKEANAIKDAYKMVMARIDEKEDKNGHIKALKCSPFIYLQILFLYYGAHSAEKESLLAIDEVQSIASEELRLLNNVNGGKVVFNMYGDIHQHIEGTKGIETWDDYKSIFDFDYYEMQENYRNASQITEYCNRQFKMEMIAINTPGKGVHELRSLEEFRSEMFTQLMDNQRTGLAAVLVSNEAEAKYLIDNFIEYKQKFHDMTKDDFSIHRTRWNIITIDDAKGLEFSSVIVLSGRMSRNQQYIAFTRALDDLYVYSEPVDISDYEKKESEVNQNDDSKEKGHSSKKENDFLSKHENDKGPTHKAKPQISHTNSQVRIFFEEKGLEVVDKRDEGGRLWVIGEKTNIRDIVNIATLKFHISGKYAKGKEIKNRSGWYTKTDK